MSYGDICRCDDERHPVHALSEVAHLGITNRCRQYAAKDQVLCDECREDGHVAKS